MKELRHSFKYRMLVIIYCLFQLCMISCFSFGIENGDMYMKIGILSHVVVFLVLRFTLPSIFEKKLEEEMKKPEPKYIELRYFLVFPLWWCIFTAYLGSPMLASIIKEAQISAVELLFLFIANIPFIISVIYLIYKALIKIVVDNGQITKYVAGRKKVSGNIYAANREQTYRKQADKNGLNGWNRICFAVEGEQVRGNNTIHYSEEMENAEQLAAFLKRRGLFEKKYYI